MSPVYFTFFGAIGALVPYLSAYFHSIGLSGTEIGVLLSLQPVLVVLSQPVFGPMTDRSGHRGRMLARILVVAAVSGLLMALGRSFWTLIPLVALWSFFAGLIVPISDSIALGEMERTGVAYPRLRLWGSLGYLIITIGMGRLYSWLDYRWGFVAYAVINLAAIGFAWRLPPDGARSTRPVWPELRRVLGNPYLLLFLLISGTLQLTVAANSTFLSMHLQSLGASAGMTGLAWGTAALFEIPTWLVLHRVSARVGPLPLLIGASGVYAARWWLYAATSNPLIIVAGSSLQAISFAIFMPTAVMMVGELVPPELRTTGQALLGLVNGGLATVLGTLGGGRIIDAIGTVGLYHVLTWVSLAAAVGFVLLLPMRPKERGGERAVG
ncbi:MAG: MFS transporter [Mycobacterium leprae]